MINAPYNIIKMAIFDRFSDFVFFKVNFSFIFLYRKMDWKLVIVVPSCVYKEIMLVKAAINKNVDWILFKIKVRTHLPR